MPEVFLSATGRHRSQPVKRSFGTNPRLQTLALIPALTVLLLVATVWVVLLLCPIAWVGWATTGAGAGGCLLVLVWASRAAAERDRQARERLELVEGELLSVKEASEAQHSDREVERDTWVQIARRLHALVAGLQESLGELQDTVEDPDLLQLLFGADHKTSQLRRRIEGLGVLGGKTPVQIDRPVPVVQAVRFAATEIEQYRRIEVLRYPPEQRMVGYAAGPVSHMLAELLENATQFSRPPTRVQVAADAVPAGVVIDVDDCGVGMSAQRLQSANALLADPEGADPRSYLREGRIGLLVSALLAQRYGVSVTLQRNQAGIKARVMIPAELLVAGEQPVAAPRSAARRSPAPVAPGGPQPAVAAAAVARLQPVPRIAPEPAAPAEASAAAADGRPPLPQRSRRSPAPRAETQVPSAPAGVNRPDGQLMARFLNGSNS